MIAIDAGELSLIRASLSSLPTFRRLFEEAALLPLRSSAEHIAASVWPTMYTGRSAGEHGISQHIQWDPAGMRMRRISSDWVYSEPFWYDLARAGLGVTVLDVPFAFENRLPQAVEVINWGSHDLMGRFRTNPPQLRAQIRRRYGRHPMGYEIPVSKDTRQLVTMQKECAVGAETKGRLARWLRDTTRWDFYLVVFGECHRGGHILWRDGNAHAHVPPRALLEVYRAVDAAVGTLLEGIDTQTTTVVVFALHPPHDGPNKCEFWTQRRRQRQSTLSAAGVDPSAAPGSPGPAPAQGGAHCPSTSARLGRESRDHGRLGLETGSRLCTSFRPL